VHDERGGFLTDPCPIFLVEAILPKTDDSEKLILISVVKWLDDPSRVFVRG
jgi:hypothetical protein